MDSRSEGNADLSRSTLSSEPRKGGLDHHPYYGSLNLPNTYKDGLDYRLLPIADLVLPPAPIQVSTNMGRPDHPQLAPRS